MRLITLAFELAAAVCIASLPIVPGAVAASANAPKVTVSPRAVAVHLNATAQFRSRVAGTLDQRVTWSVDGITGGGPNAGRISASGFYTAPPSPGTHKIKRKKPIRSQALSLSKGRRAACVSMLLGGRHRRG